jgi:hypothetical protein
MSPAAIREDSLATTDPSVYLPVRLQKFEASNLSNYLKFRPPCSKAETHGIGETNVPDIMDTMNAIGGCISFQSRLIPGVLVSRRLGNLRRTGFDCECCDLNASRWLALCGNGISRCNSRSRRIHCDVRCLSPRLHC